MAKPAWQRDPYLPDVAFMSTESVAQWMGEHYPDYPKGIPLPSAVCITGDEEEFLYWGRSASKELAGHLERWRSKR